MAIVMPVKRKLMKNLQHEYGKVKGTRVYYALETNWKKKRK